MPKDSDLASPHLQLKTTDNATQELNENKTKRMKLKTYMQISRNLIISEMNSITFPVIQSIVSPRNMSDINFSKR